MHKTLNYQSIDREKVHKEILIRDWQLFEENKYKLKTESKS